MDALTYNAPGLLFPAISLLMLAYTNRFHGLAALARHLVEQDNAEQDKSVVSQIKNLRTRINLIRRAQALGVFSLALCTGCLFLLFIAEQDLARLTFGMALLCMLASLMLLLWEIHLSARALDRALSKIQLPDDDD